MSTSNEEKHIMSTSNEESEEAREFEYNLLNECDVERFDQKIGLYLRSLEKISNNEEGERQQKAQILLERYKNVSLELLRIWWCGRDLE
ncbi:8002_t:CDS:2, partial [Scutellospora calospora]